MEKDNTGLTHNGIDYDGKLTNTIGAERAIELKNRIDAELMRRRYYGSEYSKDGANQAYDRINHKIDPNWAFNETNSPETADRIKQIQGRNLLSPLLAICDLGDLMFSVEGEIIPDDFQYKQICDLLTKLESESITGPETSCRSACTGLCIGTCITECDGCTNQCTNMCTGCGACTSGCTGCGGDCSGFCEGTCDGTCGSGCTGCLGKCEGGCYSLCYAACGNACDSGCTGTCKNGPNGGNESAGCGTCSTTCGGSCDSSLTNGSGSTVVRPFSGDYYDITDVNKVDGVRTTGSSYTNNNVNTHGPNFRINVDTHGLNFRSNIKRVGENEWLL